jgi:CubicO group peptidase (beta-lactamase class C family)
MKHLIAAALLLSVTAAPGATLTERVDAYVAPYLKVHAFSGVVLLAHKDDILVNRAYGMANYEFNVANTPDTRFRIASITKRFTQIIVTRLVDEKKLSLTDTLSKFYPSFPQADKITIDHLLNHRTGIRDPDSLRRVVPSSYTPLDVVEMLAKVPLASEPGGPSVYTTANYAVLAYVIEKVTGEPFATVMREMIYAPAGMNDSGEITSTTVIPRLASGYMPDPYADGVSVCGPEDTSWKAGGGSSYATARDLFRFARAYYGGKLLKSASPLELIQHKKMFDKRYSESDGGFPGTSACLMVFPDDEVTVVVLSNNYAPVTSAIARDVAAMHLGQPYKVTEINTPSPAPPPDRRVLGTWKLEGYPNFTVVDRNGRYVVIWNSARQEALMPLGNDEYFVPLDFSKVKFDFSGEAPQATWDAPWADHTLKVTR